MQIFLKRLKFLIVWSFLKIVGAFIRNFQIMVRAFNWNFQKKI